MMHYDTFADLYSVPVPVAPSTRFGAKPGKPSYKSMKPRSFSSKSMEHRHTHRMITHSRAEKRFTKANPFVDTEIDDDNAEFLRSRREEIEEKRKSDARAMNKLIEKVSNLITRWRFHTFTGSERIKLDKAVEAYIKHRDSADYHDSDSGWYYAPFSRIAASKFIRGKFADGIENHDIILELAKKEFEVPSDSVVGERIAYGCLDGQCVRIGEFIHVFLCNDDGDGGSILELVTM